MIALVTGGTGFVGSAVVRALLRHGWQVRVLARPQSNLANLQGLAVDLVTGDVTDESSLDRAMAGCDALFHTAADYRLGVHDCAEMYRVNVHGTANVLRAARKARVARSVVTSSVATIGVDSDGGAGRECDPLFLEKVIGHYKRSKCLAEMLAQAAAAEGDDVVIVNPSTPIGPRDRRPTPTGRMVLDAAAGRIPAYVDTGLNVVHVDDVAEGHLLAFERGRSGERYILGGENVTLAQLLTDIAGAANARAPRIRLPHAAVLPVAHVCDLAARIVGRTTQISVEAVRMARKPMYFSSERAVQELGYQWRAPILAIRDAVGWFREVGLLRR
ncbi:MAG TPA: hopanoid-associated sugar epimerase [Steroidobacteraceae bacterium]|nr:hopanoid-associated sugar epimerase [Steroidobacteraceae bacterium]